jgi:hypothetical protein
VGCGLISASLIFLEDINMAFTKGDFDRHLVKFGELDSTIDEKGSIFIALRKVQWVKNGEDPDETKAKLDLRKYRVDENGDEIAGKGISFLTDDGPNELTKVLVHEGYGNTKEILKELKNRDDFVDSVEHINEEDTGSGEYFDMRQLLEDIDTEEAS